MEAPGPDTVSAPPPAVWLRLAGVFYGAMALLAWSYREWVDGESVVYASAAAASRGIRVLPDVLAGLAVAGLTIWLSRELTRRTRTGETLARTLAAALGPLRRRDCVALAILSAIGEEAFFRGALQPSLGLLGASAVFAMVHFAPRRAMWLWSVFAFGAGLALGGLFEWTGNLLAPITAHAVVNGVNLWLLVRDFGEGGGDGDGAGVGVGVRVGRP